MGLEWTRKGYSLLAPKADGSRHWEVSVHVELVDAWFFAVGCNEKFPTLQAAKEWCEVEDAKLMPPVPLPGAGEVWGLDVPTRRFVTHVFPSHGLFFASVNREVRTFSTATDWQAWVRESGAVRIDGPREDVDALRKELEAVKEGYHALDKNWETVHEAWFAKYQEVEVALAKADQRADNAEASARDAFDISENEIAKLQAERDFAEKYRPRFAALADMSGDPHWGDILVVMSAKFERLKTESNKLRKANEIARKGLDLISRGVASWDSVNMRIMANKTLVEMNAAEGVQP